ncbi:MAG: stalk domain-containing protein [Bacillota bacterium]
MKRFAAGLLIGILLTVGVSYGNQLIALTVDYKIAVDGHLMSLAEQPVIINDRTYLPVRAVAEMLGYSVGFNDQTQTVSMTSRNANPSPTAGKLEEINALSYKIDGKSYGPTAKGGTISFDGKSLFANTYIVGEILSIINGVYDIVPTADAGLDGQIANTKVNNYAAHNPDLKLWTISNPITSRVYTYKSETIFGSPLVTWRSSPLVIDLKAVFSELGIAGSYEVTGDRVVISFSK